MNINPKTEEWKSIPGHPRYMVSSFGRVKSLVRTEHRIMRPGILDGYYHLLIDRRNKRIHCLVAAAFLGPRPCGLLINHKDGVTTNNAADNLEYCTPKENVRHAHRTGLSRPAKGESNGSAKLTSEQVLTIASRLRGGDTGRSLAAEFGVTASAISLIKRGKKWSHLTGFVSA